jgi:hypothetical protein
LLNNDPRTEVQPLYNLRPNRQQNYNNQLAHAMDDLVNTQSYKAQFLQHSDDGTLTLREAVQEMQRTESDTDALKCVTGIIMMQMMVKAGIKKHG